MAGTEHQEQRAWPRPPSVLDALLQASEALLQRGAAPPEAARTPAAGLLQLAAMQANPAYRPGHWQQTARDLLAAPAPFVRAAALARLPLPLEPAFVESVTTQLRDPALSVQAAACAVAARSKAPAFADGALAVVQTTPERALLPQAIDAARQCGATPDRWLALCADRLTDPAVALPAYEQLLNVIDHAGIALPGFLPTAADLQTAWRAFLAEHTDAVRAGTRFTLDQPPLTAALLAPGTMLYRTDGSAWGKP